MNKKIVLTMVVIAIVFTCVFSFTACNGNKAIYDIGEYGEFDEYGEIQEHEGYKFIGWANSGKQGRKTVYKAQYERKEFYLPEEKDIYITPYGNFDVFSVCYKITDMQTMQVKETGLCEKCAYSTTDNRMHLGYGGEEQVMVNGLDREFDGILTLIAEDLEFNLKQEFNLHVVRNRIKAESIEIYRNENEENKIKANDSSSIYDNTLPEDTTFYTVVFFVVEVLRNGQALPEDEAAEIAYFSGYRILSTTDKAQVGDVIRVQAYNERDPEVKSNILTIFVTED